MEEGKKKIIMAVVIVACLVAAGVITYTTRPEHGEGLGTIKPGTATIWIKCRNPDCENTWQMDKRAYFEYLQEHRVSMEVPPIVCPKCGQESGYRAEKCEKCGFIFERGAVAGDFPDRCPKCGYSAMEEARKKGKKASSDE
jgi:ribosomal protein L40E